MTIAVSCGSCQSRYNVGDHFAGKRVKCPTCGQPVPVAANAAGPAGAPKAAPPTRPAAAAPPPTQPAAAPANLLVVSCAACSKQFRVKSEFAGKTAKCPGCGKPVKIPAAPAGNDGWLDVNEAVETVSPPAAGAPGDWGQALLEQQEIPKEIEEQIKSELGEGERLVWCGRPNLDLLLHRARQGRWVGLLFFLIGIALGGGLVYYIMENGLPSEMQNLLIAGVFALIPVVAVVLGLVAIGGPGRVKRKAATRPTYLISNRRFIIHPGLGIYAASRGIRSYTAMELTKLIRYEDKKFPDCGDLILSRDLLERPTHHKIQAVDNLRAVEKQIRNNLIHPVIERVLRGEVSLKDHLGSKKETTKEEDAEQLPTENNIQSFAQQFPTDPGNVKQFQSAIAQDLSGIDPDSRVKVDAELADGEKLLWVGMPEGKTKGRGLLGALAGTAKRHEPTCALYAISNRRVIIWVERDPIKRNQGGHLQTPIGKFTIGSDKTMGRGPISYYPPQLIGTGLEDDTRIPQGGSLIFKGVRVTFRQAGKRDLIDEYCFGILHIRNVKAVTRLLFETLIRPCKTN